MMRSMSAKKQRRSPKKDIAQVDRAVKRQEQKDQGALDGRFREKVVPSKKRYVRKRPTPPTDE
jgi:hypothetical protein